MVANVPDKIEMNPSLDVYREPLDLEIKSITLSDIVDFVTNCPKNIKASFFIESDSVLAYDPDALSTMKSYIVKMSLGELVRISCADNELRNRQIQNYESLKNVKFDSSLLYENIRGFLGETKFNKNIVKTIIETPSEFFMYNNGITITAKNISANKQNVGKKLLVNLENYQIVNGGQTIRSIYKFIEEDFDVEKLSSGYILVRLFQTSENNELTNNIAEYTNSQNAINLSDLKSVSNLQRQIEAFMDGHHITYLRKIGDIGDERKVYDKRISMEKMAQILYSFDGHPERAASAKKKLFGVYYPEIFPEDLDLNKCYCVSELYFDIIAEYNKTTFQPYEQKYLYIIYMFSKDKTASIANLINLLEKTLDNFEPETSLSPSRKLLKKNFKKQIDLELQKKR